MNLDEIIDSIDQRPFYRCEDGALYCSPCEDILPQLPEGCVDLCLTDPPYGIGEKWVGGFSEKHGWGKSLPEQSIRNGWDSKPPSKEIFGLIRSRSDLQIIWGGNYFELPPSRCWLIWNKPERGFTLAEAELAWTNADNVARVCDLPRHESNRRHPTQKPLALMEWCLSLSWASGSDLILDPFLGSGTTAVACKRLGRKFIGIEISEEYCQIAKDRIQAESKGISVKELKQGQKVLF